MLRVCVSVFSFQVGSTFFLPCVSFGFVCEMVDDGDRLLWAYEDGKDLYARLQKCDGMEDDFRARVISSLDVIQSALRLFGPEKVSVVEKWEGRDLLFR